MSEKAKGWELVGFWAGIFAVSAAVWVLAGSTLMFGLSRIGGR